MFIRSFLVVMVIGLFATPAFSQFGQSNRLMDMAARLSREAEDLADANYSSYTNSSRNNRNEIEAVMLTQQFAGASRIFYRMTVDRRRNQDLRDAFDVLSRLARTVEQNNLQQSSWYNIRQLLSDIAREVSSNQNPGPFPPGTGDRSGRMTWRGRVDADVRVRIRGGSADVETLGGTPYYDSQPNFENSLPNRRVTVRLTSKRGRGEIFIEQQPSRENDFTAIIRIKDTRGGADNYEFTLEW
jgi:Flp pilus assembly protein TadG